MSQPLLRVVEGRPLLLLLEDDEHLRKCLTTCFDVRGWGVLAYGMVADAVLALERRSPVAFLLDWFLPDGEGDVVAKLARSRLPTSTIAIMTGWDAEDISCPDADALFEKPVDVDEIADLLSSSLEEERPRRRTTSST